MPKLPSFPPRDRLRLGRAGVCLVATAAASALLTSSATAAPSSGSTVKYADGTVRGVDSAAGRSFKGVPFAAAPVDNLRFREPQPASPFTGVRDATKFHDPCPQPPWPILGQPAAYTNEDCLYLNVFTPPGSVENKPVIFYVPGGGSQWGNSDDYDPARMAREGNVIVVTANLRLGALGSLAHKSLRQTKADGTVDVGNYSGRDAVQALKWIRTNIGSFGGDPGRVTTWGNSSTSILFCGVQTSPYAAGLFNSAIRQSGPCGSASKPLATSEATGETFAKAVGCTAGSDSEIAACLRSVPVAKILEAQARDDISLSGTSGTGFLPLAPEKAVAEGKFNRVATMIGTELDEARAFFPSGVISQLQPGSEGATVTPTPAEKQFSRTYPGAPQAALRRFRQLEQSGMLTGQAQRLVRQAPSTGVDTSYLPEKPDLDLYILKFLGDYGLACPMRGDADNLAKWVPTYSYEFAYRDGPQIYNANWTIPHGAYHSSDLTLLFDWTSWFGRGFDLKADERALASSMVKYVTGFAARRDPNAAGLPTWPALDARSRSQWFTTTGITTRTDFSAGHQCGLWNQLPRPWDTGIKAG